jgi:hypothetical protein
MRYIFQRVSDTDRLIMPLGSLPPEIADRIPSKERSEQICLSSCRNVDWRTGSWPVERKGGVFAALRMRMRLGIEMLIGIGMGRLVGAGWWLGSRTRPGLLLFLLDGGKEGSEVGRADVARCRRSRLEESLDRVSAEPRQDEKIRDYSLPFSLSLTEAVAEGRKKGRLAFPSLPANPFFHARRERPNIEKRGRKTPTVRARVFEDSKRIEGGRSRRSGGENDRPDRISSRHKHLRGRRDTRVGKKED